MNSVDQSIAETLKTTLGVNAPLEPPIATLARALVGPDNTLKLKTDAAGNVVSVAATKVLTAASTLTAADSGKTLFLGSATDFATTLPAPAAGLNFRFIVKTLATTTAHTIVTNGGADLIFGQILSSDGLAATLASAKDTVNLTKGATGGVVGDSIEFLSDGTNWYVKGYATVSAGMTFSVT